MDDKKYIDLSKFNKQILNINENVYNEIDENLLEKAARKINEGKLVLFPTETVYGIGADGLNVSAVTDIFIAKGRKQDNPLILHVSDFEMIKRLAKNISPLEEKLINTFMPGPFTIVLDREDIVPDAVTGGLDTVGIRMPSNIIARALIKKANTPIAAPSANISGRPSGTNVKDIFEELHDKVDYIIDGGNTFVGLESTVVKVCDDKVRILRPGKVTKENIEKIAPVIVDENVLNIVKDENKVMSPGMKYKHYAPKSKCVLVYSDDNEMLLNKMIEISNEYNKVVFLCTKENANEILKTKNNNKEINVIVTGDKNNLEEIGRNIFSDLRKVDKFNAEIVIVEGVTTEGFGLAIMNRLIRACSHNFVKI